MATLAAYDQENAVRNISIGPSGKPLNGGVKAFGAKTPGVKAPKTPFKVPLNDENVTKQAGKANGKGNENLLVTSKKGGKLDDNAFVTPAGEARDTKLRKTTTDTIRPANTRAIGLENNQCQVTSLPNTRTTRLLRKDAESQPTPAPSQSQGSPTRGGRSI